MLNEKSDEELMIAYQLGKAEAFESLYRRYSSKVLGFLGSKVASEAVAYDIFQSTFLKLHKYRSRYNASLPFAPWLFTICRNELLDYLKRPQLRNETLVAEVSEPAPGTSAPVLEIDLSSLPDVQRRALEYRYTYDFSFEDIAKTLETSPANARQLVSRAVRALRGIYGK